MLGEERDLVLEPDLKIWIENRQKHFSMWELPALEFLLQTCLFYISMYLDDKNFHSRGKPTNTQDEIDCGQDIQRTQCGASCKQVAARAM